MAGLGEKLIQARETKGLSITQVESATNINSKYISALEEERFVSLPDKAFIEKTLKTYASYLGLDYPKLLEEFNSIWMDTNTAKEFIRETYVKSPGYRSPDFFSRNKMLISISVILVAIILVFFVSSQKQPLTSEDSPSIASAEEQQQISPSPIDNNDVVDTNETNKNDNQKAVEQEVNNIVDPEVYNQMMRVTVIASRGDCWMEVKVDEDLVLYRIVQEGEELAFEATNEISILFGNAASVDVTFNDQALGQLGDEKQVIRKIFHL